jgi:hypothetical protein
MLTHRGNCICTISGLLWYCKWFFNIDVHQVVVNLNSVSFVRCLYRTTNLCPSRHGLKCMWEFFLTITSMFGNDIRQDECLDNICEGLELWYEWGCLLCLFFSYTLLWCSPDYCFDCLVSLYRTVSLRLPVYVLLFCHNINLYLAGLIFCLGSQFQVILYDIYFYLREWSW